MRLGFHGSRTLNDERVRIIVLEEIKKHQPTSVVTHAEPEGVCETVRQLCRDHAIFIHDGRSKGTSNEITLAQKMGLPHTVHHLEITRFKASVGFEIDKEWEAESLDMDLMDVDLPDPDPAA